MNTDLTQLDVLEKELAGIIPTHMKSEDYVNLQMVLVNASMNHAYLLEALKKAKTHSQIQELDMKLNHVKSVYYVARTKLSECNPDRMIQIESELLAEKKVILSSDVIH